MLRGRARERRCVRGSPTCKPHAVSTAIRGDERAGGGASVVGAASRAGFARGLTCGAQATPTGVGGREVAGAMIVVSSRRHRYVITMTSRSRARRILEAVQKACESATKARAAGLSWRAGRGCECHEGCSSVVPFPSRQAQSQAAGRQLQLRCGRCVPSRHRRRVNNANEILCPCALPLLIRHPSSLYNACPAARTSCRPLS